MSVVPPRHIGVTASGLPLWHEQHVPSGMVPELRRRRVERHLGRRRPRLHRRLLRRDGQGPRAGLLRLHADRGQAHGLDRLRRHDGVRPQARREPQARPGSARRADGQRHQRLGVVPTMSTSFYPPFLLARLCSTIDHIAAAGSAGTSSPRPRTARRRTSASTSSTSTTSATPWPSEYLEARHASCGTRGSPTRSSATTPPARTPITRRCTPSTSRASTSSRAGRSTPRRPAGPPDHRPGRRVAARPRARGQHADTIVAPANGIEAMKAYRDDIRARMEANGRNPDDCKVLYLVSPIVADTDEEAHAKRAALAQRPALHRVPAGRDLLDHRDRLLAVRPRRAAAGGEDQRRARLPGELRRRRQGQDAARARHRQRHRRQHPVRRHPGRGGRARWARSWTRSAATGS